jgi:copper homeostasis protein
MEVLNKEIQKNEIESPDLYIKERSETLPIINKNESFKSEILIEACVETYEQCVFAEKNQAHRIELCADLAKGGTTPSFGLIKKVKENLKIPVFVIIRPRGGNFLYSNNEIDIMLYDIHICLSLRIDGFVFGILNSENCVDYYKNKILLNTIRSYEKNNNLDNKIQVTFHMAFDEISIEKQKESIDLLVDLGFDRILTKGSKTNAIDGKEQIKRLVEYANNRIIIMPGGGVTKENFYIFIDNCGCKEVHGTKII